MGTTIHQLRGIITSEIGDFLSGMRTAAGATRNLRQSWVDAQGAIWSMSQRILTAVTGMTVGITKVFADFEDQMIEVGAITRTIGTHDFELLKKAALDMGETTRYSATEAAVGLKQLSTSGLNTQQAIAALKPTLQLATSASVSIGQAATISAKLMKAMGLEAGELTRVNDILVSTFQRGSTDLVSLSEGMKHAGPVAHALGVSLEDVTAILSKLSDAGFVGEMGGTALRNIMSRLAGALPRMTKQFNELGIVTLDASGNMRPLLDILEDFEKKGLSTGKVMELFGQRGGPQLAALLEQGIASIRNFSYETSLANGQAAEVLEQKKQSIQGKFDELVSYLESIFLEAGEKISPAIKDLIKSTETYFRAQKPEIIEAMTKASKGLITGMQSLREWLTNNREAVWQLLRAFGSFVDWMAQFATAHPQLMAGLVALKVSGLLGIYDAALKTVTALFQTVAALFAQSVAARTAAASTAATAAATGGLAAGAATATGAVSALRLALSTLMGPWGLLLGAVTVGIAGWCSQMDRFGKSVENAADKFNKLQEEKRLKVSNQTGNDLEEIRGEATSSRRRRLAAEKADEAAAELKRLDLIAKDWKKNPDAVLPQKGINQVNDLKNQAQRTKELRQETLNESTALVNPKIVDAARQNKMAADDMADAFKALQEQLRTGGITAREFNDAVDLLAESLDVVSRGFDPQIEKLFQFNRALDGLISQDMHVGGDNVRQDAVEFNKILRDLNTYKNKLGASFGDITAQLGQLNLEFEMGVISQEEYRAGLKKIREQTDVPARNDKTSTIEREILANELQSEKDEFADFEVIQELVGTDDDGEWDVRHLNAAGVKAIGESVEGATPEIVEQLVDDFTALQAGGEAAVAEGMDKLILSFLRAVEKAKDDAEEQNSLIDSANEAYKRGGTQSDVQKYGKASGGPNNALLDAFRRNQNAAYDGKISADQYKERDAGIGNVAGQSTSALDDVKKLRAALDAAAKQAGACGVNAEKFSQQIKDLVTSFANGTITEDQFTDKLKQLRDTMAEAAATGEALLQKEKQLQQQLQEEIKEKTKLWLIAQGKFAEGGVDIDKLILQKLAGFSMDKLNKQIDDFIYKTWGLGNATSELKDGFEKLGDGLTQYATKAGNWYESNFGEGASSNSGSIANSWNNFVNSVMGQVASLNNQISQMAQGLHLLNIPLSRRIQLEKQIEDLMRKRDALLAPQEPIFTAMHADPIYTDPGVGGNQQQSAPSTVNYNFPNVNKFTSEDISKLNDALAQDRKRRGMKI